MPPERELDVVVAGLAVVDIIGKPVEMRRLPKAGGLQVIDTLEMTTGGNVSNVGIDLAKLGFRVGLISRVGNDSLGRFLLQEYGRHRIDTSAVIVDQKRQTSATVVGVDASGERTFLHTRGAMKNFAAKDVLDRLDLIGKAPWFVFGYVGLLPEMEKHLPAVFQSVKERTGARILLDTGGNPPRLTARSLKRLLGSVDCFIPSFEEAVRLTGKKTPEKITEEFFQAESIAIAGVKLGSRGCYIADRHHAEYIPAKKVRRVVDTTGAGDAFAAGFVGAMLKGFDPFRSARIANAVAAASVAELGASTAIGPIGQYLNG